MKPSHAHWLCECKKNSIKPHYWSRFSSMAVLFTVSLHCLVSSALFYVLSIFHHIFISFLCLKKNHTHTYPCTNNNNKTNKQKTLFNHFISVQLLSSFWDPGNSHDTRCWNLETEKTLRWLYCCSPTSISLSPAGPEFTSMPIIDNR